MSNQQIQYVPGEINQDYVIVKNDKTMPKSALRTPWGLYLPGQNVDGYGSKITTDLMLQFTGEKKRYRIYATCFANAASHWIIWKGEKLYLPTIFCVEIRNEFLK